MKSSLFLILALSLSTAQQTFASGFSDFFGPRFSGAQTARTAIIPKNGLDTLHRWNQIAIDASGVDHTPVAPGEVRTFGEQLGPTRASRAMAIVHIAIFDSVNAIKIGRASCRERV